MFPRAPNERKWTAAKIAVTSLMSRQPRKCIRRRRTAVG